MSGYRRPKIGRIRNGALRTNQGPSQNLNEPEPAAIKGTRDARQAFKPVRTTELVIPTNPSLAAPNEPYVPQQTS
jgi:hypothetical protein